MAKYGPFERVIISFYNDLAEEVRLLHNSISRLLLIRYLVHGKATLSLLAISH